MGGEPLSPKNEFLTSFVIKTVREKVPNVKIYVWTGYLYEDLMKNTNSHMKMIFENIDYLIDGPYIEEERDVTLPMRGSRNQRIIPIDR
jgi:anaerobic ribonucleoside-triphosphate reductase activating protein